MGMNATFNAIAGAAGLTYLNWLQGTMTEAEAELLFKKKWDGTLITTDNWDYYENADYPSKPDDEEEEGPFLADPRDLRESYDELVRLKTTLYDQLFAYSANASALQTVIGTIAAGDPWGVEIINQTCIANPLIGQSLSYLLTNAIGGPYLIYTDFEKMIPKKAGYLYLALEGGLPVYTPTADYLRKMVEEFNIKDDFVETGHPAMDGVIPFTCDVEVEGMVITMEFEFDDYPDPADWEVDCDLTAAEVEAKPDELEDWEVVFTYSEYGSQAKIQYMDGDEIFFEKGGVDQIPGYEVTIILGASALSILALIYVVMKKRKM
jgi:hypothetical protein